MQKDGSKEDVGGSVTRVSGPASRGSVRSGAQAYLVPPEKGIKNKTLSREKSLEDITKGLK